MTPLAVTRDPLKRLQVELERLAELDHLDPPFFPALRCPGCRRI
jgi:hypothetical protein